MRCINIGIPFASRLSIITIFHLSTSRKMSECSIEDVLDPLLNAFTSYTIKMEFGRNHRLTPEINILLHLLPLLAANPNRPLGHLAAKRSGGIREHLPNNKSMGRWFHATGDGLVTKKSGSLNLFGLYSPPLGATRQPLAMSFDTPLLAAG
ncbi:MAG: hypothetical protein ABSC19_15385 [Syntrophorhabdales bacterium]|jgi:hypothetical protein